LLLKGQQSAQHHSQGNTKATTIVYEGITFGNKSL
jgi:hypothetical protein